MKTNRSFDAGALREAAFTSIDDPCNSFLKIADVQSDLLYGNPAAISAPEFSVILPTFQRRELFREALDSILAQEPIDVSWECLVVDNTPLDAQNETPALEVVRQRNDCRVLYYHNRVNIGSGYNWNRAAELARGKWLVFLHDDDVMYPDALRNILRILRMPQRGAKPLGYIHARRDQFTDFQNLSDVKRSDKAYSEELTRFKSLIIGASQTGMPSCGTTILKQAYLETGGINYDFGLTADAILGYQIMKKYRVIISGPSLGAYRWSDNETLKVASLQKLIYSDYLFAKYRYSQSVFSRGWGCLFWRAEYEENLKYKCKTGTIKEFALSPQDLSVNVAYHKVNRAILLCYKILRKMCLIFCGVWERMVNGNDF